MTLPPKAVLAARLVIAAVLLFSGLHKASAPYEEFAAVLETYKILPDPHIPLFARLLPWSEVLVGVFLAAGWMTRAAAGAAAALLATFLSALGWALSRHIYLENCGCFGASIHLKPWQAMLLDACLLGCSLAVFRGADAGPSVDGWVEAAG